MGVTLFISGINIESSGIAIKAKPKPVIPCVNDARNIVRKIAINNATPKT